MKNKKSNSNKSRKLNHSESAKRGVAKIFKGFKLGKRRSAAYKLMGKKHQSSLNKNKLKVNSKSKNTLNNARVIKKLNHSFTQLSTNK